jgi:cytoskeletal protein CcmA (bactofilin family)
VLPERSPFSSTVGPSAGHDVDDGEVKIPVLGKTLLFRGELTAEEDVCLQGRVEGSIRHARSLIIGTDGSVLGDVYANHLTVEGLVEGDLHGTEAVVVRATAQVRGNIFAPRVAIMEGATFNGRVEMDPGAAAAQAGQQGNSRPATQKPPAPARSGQTTPPGRAGAAAPSAPGRSGTPSTTAASTAGSAATPASASSTGASLTNAGVDQLLSAQTPTRK